MSPEDVWTTSRITGLQPDDTVASESYSPAANMNDDPTQI